MSFVLYVSSLLNNLLYVCLSTKRLYFYVTLFPRYCVFQHILTKMTIGIGREMGDLYYFEEAEDALIHAGLVFEADDIIYWKGRILCYGIAI